MISTNDIAKRLGTKLIVKLFGKYTWFKNHATTEAIARLLRKCTSGRPPADASAKILLHVRAVTSYHIVNLNRAHTR